MSDRNLAHSLPGFPSAVVTAPAAVRPVAARTKLQLEGPVLSTLLRLSAPNVLNLLAIAGMITFDGLFSAVSARMRSPASRSPSRS